ncbi:hypothetical protein NBRC10512_000613 [Rhodotorula toruloides]|uniref:RHTO0S01e05908g1_1 n=2 Tax=Rhodotorula toruloides TaxID=5286 RepID=A0A061ADT6_RHOTO|nr:uncharacterized protein RHTO_01426 [Rhodotorula toruloides NP11]EMS21779.1 hypothetical protein RHTO_01426 [Rhodotorula toruloides NP11]CDR35732.1 RHTO0S01e05908g1_1 [Rhodotorula toruloides]
MATGPNYQQVLPPGLRWAGVEEELVVRDPRGEGAVHGVYHQPQPIQQYGSSLQHPSVPPTRRSSTGMVSLSPNFTSPNATSVSFNGTASFAPLPFPPSEHPLPPPPEDNPVCPVSTAADTASSHDKTGPPPPYSEQPNLTEHQAAIPGVVLFQQPIVPALPPPLPAPSFRLARPPSHPQPVYAPILTPWPPVPLRHIDAYLAGAHPYPQVYPSVPGYPLLVPASMPSPPAPLMYPIGSENVAHIEPRVEPSPPQAQVAPMPVAPIPIPAPAPLPLAPLSDITTAVATYGSPTEPTLSACMHRGCYAPVFCELSPCGCRLCRDHLGWVIRNVRTLDVEANRFLAPNEAKETKAKTKKVFRCVSCGAESSKADPPSRRTPSLSTQHPAGPSGGVAQEDFRSFSIKYFSSGPTPYAPAAEEPAEQSAATNDAYAAEAGVTGDSNPVHQSPATIVSPFSSMSSMFVPSSHELGVVQHTQASSMMPPTTAPSVAPPTAAYSGLPAKPLVARPPLPPLPHDFRFPATAPPLHQEQQRAQLATTAPQQQQVPPASTSSIGLPSALSATERPSSALPAPQPRTLEQAKVEETQHGGRRSATSPPDLIIPNPLETKITETKQVDTPSSLSSELTLSSTSPSLPTKQQADPPAAPVGPPATPPTQPLFRHEQLPTQGQAYATGLPVLTRPSFPPGSICVVPRSTSGPFPATHHAATVPNVPVITWTGGRQKSHSFHASNGVLRPAAKFDGPVAARNIPPRQPPDTYPEADSVQLEKTRWPLVKAENIPFHTKKSEIEAWLPKDALPPKDEVEMPIHLILHRATGRTLPHCYIETASIDTARRFIELKDKSILGDRTVRVKWERPGELLRDLFGQDAYFRQPSVTPAAAPLPLLPPQGFNLPAQLISHNDLWYLVSYCEKPIDWRERPVERPFYAIVSVIAKFPWSREDVWNAELRDKVFHATLAIFNKAQECSTCDEGIGFKAICKSILHAAEHCPAFTAEQKEMIRKTNRTSFDPSPANFPTLPSRLPPPRPMPLPRAGLTTPPQVARSLPFTPESQSDSPTRPGNSHVVPSLDCDAYPPSPPEQRSPVQPRKRRTSSSAGGESPTEETSALARHWRGGIGRGSGAWTSYTYKAPLNVANGAKMVEALHQGGQPRFPPPSSPTQPRGPPQLPDTPPASPQTERRKVSSTAQQQDAVHSSYGGENVVGWASG